MIGGGVCFFRGTPRCNCFFYKYRDNTFASLGVTMQPWSHPPLTERGGWQIKLTEEPRERITFGEVVRAEAGPLFKLQTEIRSISLLILLSAALIFIFILLLNRKKSINVGKSFVLINVYYLFVMLVMIAGKLI